MKFHKNNIKLSEIFSLSPAGSRKVAFTLAEVLITLGIIGVVAAMTMPTLVQKQQKKTLETAFKKSYSTLAQVMQKVILDDYGGTYVYDRTQLINYVQKYYVKSVSCTNGTACKSSIFPTESWGSTEAATVMKNIYKTYNNNSGECSYFNDGVIAVADGSFIFFDTSAETQETYGMLFIAVDVNGWKKGPNKYGHDFFAFQVDAEKGSLLPMGKEGTYFLEDKYCSNTSTSISNGLGCTSKALNDPNYFTNLP